MAKGHEESCATGGFVRILGTTAILHVSHLTLVALFYSQRIPKTRLAGQGAMGVPFLAQVRSPRKCAVPSLPASSGGSLEEPSSAARQFNALIRCLLLSSSRLRCCAAENFSGSWQACSAMTMESGSDLFIARPRYVRRTIRSSKIANM